MRSQFFLGNVTIFENLAYCGGGLSLSSGAITIINPNAYINFTGNRAMYKGGAVYVQDYCFMIINPNAYINFTGNRAMHKGGAVYVQDYCFRYGATQCFFRPKGESQSTIYFQGNYAKTAGSAPYGGSVDTCYLNRKDYKGKWSFFKMAHFDELSLISTELSLISTELSLISSDATRVCICNRSRPDCTYSGQTDVLINAVAVGQGLGTSPATIHSTILDSGTEYIPVLGELQASQVADKHCKT